MGNEFENFVNLELPRRPALLTYEITGYQGDPNDSGAPDILKGAPKGTFYLRNTDAALWRKKTASATSWEVVGSGGAASTSTSLISAASYTCPSGATVGAFVYLASADTVALALADAASTMPAICAIASKSDSTHCLVQYGGDLGGYSLTADSTYYISTTVAGAITAVAPTTGVLQAVGTSRNTGTLTISINSMGYVLL
jgi:hypothetical protein